MLKSVGRRPGAFVQLLAILISRLVYAHDDGDVLWFRSRPDLTPPALHITTSEDGIVPGYIFMAPYQTDQMSPVIYDMQGRLVWSGYGSTGGGNAHAFHVCTLNETDHLCFFRGEQGLGYGRGFIDILNQNFTSVASVRAQNGASNLDMHENIIAMDGSSMLVTSYTPERADLTDYNVTTGEGWVLNVFVQKIDIATGSLLWEWSAINHVALADSYVLPNTTEVAGTGFTATEPWDWVHVNSADENADGDFLISARHTNTVYKVSGQDGSIIWRLGGKQSDFEFADGFIFSSQHDARWRASNASTDIITLFDNASNGYQNTSEVSSGMIIKIDHASDPPRATLLSSFAAPEDIPFSSSQGNVQILGENSDWATSNAFIGWGSQPYVTEHLPSGEIIFQANVKADGPMNYRAYKFNFTSSPIDHPALYIYARSTDSDPTMFFMSWNGATEVARWRIYGRGTCDANWTTVGEVDRDGFETQYQAAKYWAFGMAEALDSGGNSLSNSSSRGVKTFVPSPLLAQNCDITGCSVATEYVQGSGDQAVMQTTPGCAAAPNDVSSSSSGSASENLASRHVQVNELVMTAGFVGAVMCAMLV